MRELRLWAAAAAGPAVTLPTDPNLLYDTRRALDEFGILRAEEAEAFARLLLVDKADHGRLHGVLSPAVARFDALGEDEQERFRDVLSRFVRTYSFLSLIVPFGDTALERDYLFGRALLQLIRSDAGEAVDLGEAVELTHLRVEQGFSGSVSLDEDVGEVRTVYSGEGRAQELDPSPCRGSSSGSTSSSAPTWAMPTGSSSTQLPPTSSTTSRCK
jgi:type I restriction enzyme R subunit